MQHVQACMWRLLFLNLLKLLLQLFLHISFFHAQVWLLFLGLFNLLILQDFLLPFYLFQFLDCCDFFLTLSSVNLLCWLFIATGRPLLFLLLAEFFWFILFFEVLIFLGFLLIFFTRFLCHRFSFVDDIEVGTDKVVDSELINVFFWNSWLLFSFL